MSSGQGLFFSLSLPFSFSHDDESCSRRVREVARSSRMRFYCRFSSFGKKQTKKTLLCVLFSLRVLCLFSHFPSLLCSPPLQSASHIAASPKVSAKVKKDNMKYAAWATSQINRAYKVRDTVIPSPSFSPRLHPVGKLRPTSRRLFPTSLARQ